eukprot:4538090-Prymnesium_polylepis.2
MAARGPACSLVLCSRVGARACGAVATLWLEIFRWDAELRLLRSSPDACPPSAARSCSSLFAFCNSMICPCRSRTVFFSSSTVSPAAAADAAAAPPTFLSSSASCARAWAAMWFASQC